jgi:hypothetical protein
MSVCCQWQVQERTSYGDPGVVDQSGQGRLAKTLLNLRGSIANRRFIGYIQQQREKVAPELRLQAGRVGWFPNGSINLKIIRQEHFGDPPTDTRRSSCYYHALFVSHI